jgi:hypothetical protein
MCTHLIVIILLQHWSTKSGMFSNTNNNVIWVLIKVIYWRYEVGSEPYSGSCRGLKSAVVLTFDFFLQIYEKLKFLVIAILAPTTCCAKRK